MRLNNRRSGVMLAALPLLAGLTTFAQAESPPPRGTMMDEASREQMMRQFGPGMMGPGYGYGMMNRERFGYGYGPGPGYGYGYGPGGRHMMGPGMMMGMGPMMAQFDDLNLTREQRQKVWQLRRELRDQHMKLMDKMWEESEKMEDLESKDKPDPKEVSKAYERIQAMQREMIEHNVQFRNKLYDVLNDEQRKKLKEYGPPWMWE